MESILKRGEDAVKGIEENNRRGGMAVPIPPGPSIMQDPGGTQMQPEKIGGGRHSMYMPDGVTQKASMDDDQTVMMPGPSTNQRSIRGSETGTPSPSMTGPEGNQTIMAPAAAANAPIPITVPPEQVPFINMSNQASLDRMKENIPLPRSRPQQHQTHYDPHHHRGHHHHNHHKSTHPGRHDYLLHSKKWPAPGVTYNAPHRHTD
jgi:hypothetical protein